MLRSLKELLASDDLNAATFDDSGEFLDYVRSHLARLAVLDVWMPAQSGIEVQERRHHLPPETRAIFISGHEEPATRALALAGGGFAFLRKPLDDEAFLSRPMLHSPDEEYRRHLFVAARGNTRTKLDGHACDALVALRKPVEPNTGCDGSRWTSVRIFLKT